MKRARPSIPLARSVGSFRGVSAEPLTFSLGHGANTNKAPSRAAEGGLALDAGTVQAAARMVGPVYVRRPKGKIGQPGRPYAVRAFHTGAPKFSGPDRVDLAKLEALHCHAPVISQVSGAAVQLLALCAAVRNAEFDKFGELDLSVPGGLRTVYSRTALSGSPDLAPHRVYLSVPVSELETTHG